MKDLARPPDPNATGKPSGIQKKGPPPERGTYKKGPSPERGILKNRPKYQGPPRTDSETRMVASTKGLPFMKDKPDNTAELESYGMGKTPPSRNAVLRPENPIGNTGHGRERPEELKVRVPSSKPIKKRNKYANRRARKLQNKIEEALLARDLGRAILANLESEMKGLETENPEFVELRHSVESQHSEHYLHNMEEQPFSEGGDHGLPLPPG